MNRWVEIAIFTAAFALGQIVVELWDSRTPMIEVIPDTVPE
jgi:hypothetical protein